MAISPEQRSQRASIAGLARWAKEDPTPVAKRMRDARRAKLRLQVDPDGSLPEEERERRVDTEIRLHMRRMAYASSIARSRGGKSARRVERGAEG